jgi:putative NIF3 family GTP cyclohydrolase 1 type 2
MKSFRFQNLWLFALLFIVSFSNQVNAITARQLVSNIIAQITAEPFPNTIDVFKAGNPDDEVQGVAVCMFATMDVLKQAVASKCNFIITHEPVFYNHTDETESFKNDPVVQEKKKFIAEHHLIIWRFHDYWHSATPDGVLKGVAIKLGWEKYLIGNNSFMFQIPQMTVQDLLNQLKQTFPGSSFQLVGKPEMVFTKVGFAPGASGSGAHFKLLTEHGAEVLLIGEVGQWETYEYVRDAVAQGENKALIILGHIHSEEAGMEYCAAWLKTFFKDAPVTFLECGSSYKVY